MHPVVAAYLREFSQKHPNALSESKLFEAFGNYIVYKKYCLDSISLSSLYYEGDDPGIDGVLFFIDDEHVDSVEEVREAFSGKKKDKEVLVAFIQAKTRDSWVKKEINNFESAVTDFLKVESIYPLSEYMMEKKRVLFEIINHVGRIKNGKPDCDAYFINTAPEAKDREIIAAFSALRAAILDSGLFHNVKAHPLGRDGVVDLWNASDGAVEANLPIIGLAAFPKSPGISGSYVVTVKAKDFIARILSDEEGRLRKRIFEDNVRDFIGLDEGINGEISEALHNQEKRKRFGILNNGITIISSDVRPQNTDLFLRDFQIVNGCQTSNILFENKDIVGEDATLMLKAVETEDAAVIDEIVKATNRQNKVQDEQFLATMKYLKTLENYFQARSRSEDQPLFFERRPNQYRNENVPDIRKFGIKDMARLGAAMFLDRPDIASRYPNRLTGEMRDLVFRENYIEDIFYTAAYTYYKFEILRSNRRFDPKYGKLRWHIFMAIKLYVAKGETFNISSPKIKSLCDKIYKLMSGADEDTLKVVEKLAEIIAEVSEMNVDRLKGAPLTKEIKEAIPSRI